MPTAPLALFGDLGFQELLLVAAVSVMIFGRRLPEVAGQAFAQFQRVRRTLSEMWRETGIDEELRRIQRDLDRKKPLDRRLPKPPTAAPKKTVSRDETPPEEAFVRPSPGPGPDPTATSPTDAPTGFEASPDEPSPIEPGPIEPAPMETGPVEGQHDQPRAPESEPAPAPPPAEAEREPSSSSSEPRREP